MSDIKPTPTQDENDRAAMGEHVVDKEPDGSDPQPPPDAEPKEKQSEAKKPSGGGYTTRAVQANEGHEPAHQTRHRRGE